MTIKTLSSRVVYENPWMSVREDEVEFDDGLRGTYSVVDRPDFAVVLPFDKDGFHLVEQFRYPSGQRSWEFPSGSWPPGVSGPEDEMAAAELAEETGFTGSLTKIGFLHCANGTMGQGVHVYLATDLVEGEPAREPAEQDMVQRWFPRAEVEQMIRDGVLTDAPSVAAYFLWTLTAQSRASQSRRSSP